MTGWRHVSLFSGVGGFDLAAEQVGIPTAVAVEIDDAARGVLAHRFPTTTLHRDVHEVTGDDLRAAGAVPERTVLTGGFPCQPFSVAGRRGGVDDARGELFWQIDRILAEFPAAWVVLENVPGLLSIDGGRTMGTILRDLGERGYGFCYRVLDSQHFGVPQRRRRVVIVGRLGDDRGPVRVLLEPEGGGGDPAAGVEAGPGAAGRAAAGVGDARVTVVNNTGHGWWNDADRVAATLRADGNETASRVDSLVVRTLTSHGRRMSGDSDSFVIDTATKRGVLADGGVVGTLTTGLSSGGPDAAHAQAGRLVPYVKVIRSGARDDDGNLPPEVWAERDTAPTLNVMDNGGESRATVLTVTGDVTHTLRAEGADASEDGTGRGTPIVAFAWQAGGNDDSSGAFNIDGMTPTLPKSQTIAVHSPTTAVRRLTPVECERLQGFPDDWTSHRVQQTGAKAGTVVPQADSNRYRQMGNAVTVNVMRWVLARILDTETAS